MSSSPRRQAFSVRGVASTEADLQHFQSAMASLPGVTMQPGQVQPTGTGKAARIFNCSGEVHYPDSVGSPKNRLMMARDQVGMALQRFVSAAKAQGIDLPQPQLRDSSVVGGAVRLPLPRRSALRLRRLAGPAGKTADVPFQPGHPAPGA